MNGTENADVEAFLCHSSGDKEKVRDLYRRLKDDGIACWFDEEDLLPGQDWDREIRKALRKCRYVLACLSIGSITKTGYVQKELNRALDRADEQPEGTIYLIPILLEPCDVPDRLQRLHRVDLFDLQGYEKLLRVLRLDPTGHDAEVSDRVLQPQQQDKVLGDPAQPEPPGSTAHNSTTNADPAAEYPVFVEKDRFAPLGARLDPPEFGPDGSSPPTESEAWLIAEDFVLLSIPDQGTPLHYLVNNILQDEALEPARIWLAEHLGTPKLRYAERARIRRERTREQASRDLRADFHAALVGNHPLLGDLTKQIYDLYGHINFVRIRRLVRWIREDPVIRLPPGSACTKRNLLTTGLSRTELSASRLGLRAIARDQFPQHLFTSPAAVMAEIFDTGQQVEEELQLTNNSQQHYREFAWWHRSHELLFEKLSSATWIASMDGTTPRKRPDTVPIDYFPIARLRAMVDFESAVSSFPTDF